MKAATRIDRIDRSDRHTNNLTLAAQPAPLDTSHLRYDYEQVDAAHRDQVRAAAVHIQTDLDQAQNHFFAVGDRLLEVKALLPHGQFSAWIAAEFPLSERMVQNLMNVAREVNTPQERKRLSLFAASSVFLLAAPSTPPEAREAIVAEAEATGQVPSRDEMRQTIQGYRGVATVPADPAFATVAELQLALLDWMRDQYWFADGQRQRLEAMLADPAHADLTALNKSLRKLVTLGAYRPEDLTQAMRNVLELRQRQKAFLDAQPPPPPPKPEAPGYWQLQPVIENWLKPKELEAKQGHALLCALREQEDQHPAYAELVALLPKHWQKRALKHALSEIIERLAAEFGAKEWEPLRLPSGLWYVVNKASSPVATGGYATAEEAMLHRDKADYHHRRFYKDMAEILTHVGGQWTLQNMLSSGTPDQIREVKLGLEQAAALPDPPAFVAERLQRVQVRLAEARKLLEMAGAVVLATQPLSPITDLLVRLRATQDILRELVEQMPEVRATVDSVRGPLYRLIDDVEAKVGLT